MYICRMYNAQPVTHTNERLAGWLADFFRRPRRRPVSSAKPFAPPPFARGAGGIDRDKIAADRFCVRWLCAWAIFRKRQTGVNYSRETLPSVRELLSFDKQKSRIYHPRISSRETWGGGWEGGRKEEEFLPLSRGIRAQTVIPKLELLPGRLSLPPSLPPFPLRAGKFLAARGNFRREFIVMQ